MEKKTTPPVGFVAVASGKGEVSQSVISAMDKMTNDWFSAAARGECGWICPDCCMSDHKGMPAFCMCGSPGCDRLLVRDLLEGNKDNPDVDYGFKLMDQHGKANGTSHYTMSEGDSIDTVCAKHGISHEDFEKWNGFQNGHSWPTPTGYVYVCDPLIKPILPKSEARVTLAQVKSIGEPEPNLPGQLDCLPPASEEQP